MSYNTYNYNTYLFGLGTIGDGPAPAPLPAAPTAPDATLGTALYYTSNSVYYTTDSGDSNGFYTTDMSAEDMAAGGSDDEEDKKADPVAPKLKDLKDKAIVEYWHVARAKAGKIDSKMISNRKVVATGNFGQVEIADLKDGLSTKKIAIKTLLASGTGGTTGLTGAALQNATKQAINGFIYEARALAILSKKARKGVLGALGVTKDSKHCINVLGMLEENEIPTIVLEVAEFGSLAPYVFGGDAAKTFANDAAKLDVLHQIASGIRECHKCRIVHNDIAPRNVLVHKDKKSGKLEVRLTDFGLARPLPKSREFRYLLNGEVRPANECAPETLHGVVTFSSDVFMFFNCLWQVLSGQHLFSENMSQALAMARDVAIGKSPTLPASPAVVKAGVADLYARGTAWDASELKKTAAMPVTAKMKSRPTIDAVVTELSKFHIK